MRSSVLSMFLTRLLSICCMFGFLPQQVWGASTCGPGAHWVDTCSGETATFSIVMKFGLATKLGGFADYEAQFEGNMTVKRSDPVALDPINDPLHLNYINTEILSMYLVGTAAPVNGWILRAGADQGLAPTTGYIQESADANIATDLTNLAFIIDGTPYGTLHPTRTVFFSASIDRFPSLGTMYNHAGGPFGTNVPLYDANNNFVLKFTDLFNTDWITVGRPQYEITAVVPLPPAIIMFGSGLFGLLVPSVMINKRRMLRARPSVNIGRIPWSASLSRAHQMLATNLGARIK